MRTSLLTTILALAALNAAAEAPSAPALSHDPLMRQIMSKQLTQTNGGVTAAVRIGSGQAITLNLIDPLSASISADGPLKDAVADPKALAGLKPAEGLAVKPAKIRAHKKPRRADEQLKKLSTEERRADWSGRK